MPKDPEETNAEEGAREDPAEEVGIPGQYRIKRAYTMSPEALAQRRAAAAKPHPGMVGKRNNWRHGEYAKSMLTRIRPCLSTCDKYPCELVESGATEAGGDCLDASELLGIIRSVHQALTDPKASADFIEISAVNIGNSIRILEMLQEDILRDGTMIRSRKFDKDGRCYQEEVKLHPSLYALPKMIADLGMTPDQFMLTPKALAKSQNETEAVRTIGDMISAVGAKLSNRHKKSIGPGDGAD